jgi:succinate-semialdehyde dehydrogenase/glutarate-semialdehyde dehydrogenase
MYTELGLFIDGTWIGGGDRPGQPVINPATEEKIGNLPHATAADLDRAVAAAEKAFKTWRDTSAFERSKIMHQAAALVRERTPAIARILTQEEGKVVADARLEVSTTADIIDWNAEEGRRAYGRVVPGRVRGARQFVFAEPVGVVAAFTPWNFPALTPMRKIAAALATGCTIIIKAAEEAPGTVVELVRCFADAGLPPGVLNLVFGIPAKVSEHLIASPTIRKISFTGSVPVGKHLAQLAAAGMKRATMELGGHAPVVVFDDANLEKAAELSCAGKFRNAGQICISPTRFYVQEGAYRRFLGLFTERAKALKVGNGLEDGVTMGPLANRRRLDAMESLVADCRRRGATILTGGRRIGERGFFFEPTIVTDIDDASPLMTQEPFGPIAPIVPFKTFDEVVARANSLQYGLAAYAFTGSHTTAAAIGAAIESGMVGVNSVAISTPETPFGGVKESGYGQEGGIEGLDAYLNKKFVVEA